MKRIRLVLLLLSTGIMQRCWLDHAWAQTQTQPHKVRIEWTDIKPDTEPHKYFVEFREKYVEQFYRVTPDKKVADAWHIAIKYLEIDDEEKLPNIQVTKTHGKE